MSTVDIEIDKYSDSSKELTLEKVKAKAVRGIATLTARTILLQLFNLAAIVLLPAFLTPGQYGTYFVVVAFVSIFARFSDVGGLAVALIQKKELKSDQDLITSFTVQTGFVLLLLLIIFLGTPLYRQFYHLDQLSIYLVWALSFELLLASLKSIPTILMQRKLDFQKLIIPQLAETVLFQLLVIFLAWKGWGITSFTIAVLARGLVGLSLIYWLQPWRPKIAIDLPILKQLLRYGLPYQANNLLAAVKDDGVTVVLGGILGLSNLGLFGWAQKWAMAPLRFFMDQVITVTFPAYSRMQENKEALSKAVSKSIKFVCLLVFPSLIMLIILAPILVSLVPRYGKWQPAILALGLISINSAWAAVTTPLTNALNAIGKVVTTFRLMIMWTILTWLLIPTLAYLFGINGAAIGCALVGSSSIVAILVSAKQIKIDWWGSIGKPLIASVILGLILLVSKTFLPVSWLGVIYLSLEAIGVYLILIYLLIGPTLKEDIQKLILAFRKI